MSTKVCSKEYETSSGTTSREWNNIFNCVSSNDIVAICERGGITISFERENQFVSVILRFKFSPSLENIISAAPAFIENKLP